LGIVNRIYCDCCGNIISKLHGKAIKGGVLRKVALLGCSTQHVRFDVAPKARHLTAVAAVLVLETQVPGNLEMVKPSVEMMQPENRAKEARCT
jgi:hypothetical protein